MERTGRKRDLRFLSTREKELQCVPRNVSEIAISGLGGATYVADAARRKLQTTDLVTISAETDAVYLGLRDDDVAATGLLSRLHRRQRIGGINVQLVEANVV